MCVGPKGDSEDTLNTEFWRLTSKCRQQLRLQSSPFGSAHLWFAPAPLTRNPQWAPLYSTRDLKNNGKERKRLEYLQPSVSVAPPLLVTGAPCWAPQLRAFSEKTNKEKSKWKRLLLLPILVLHLHLSLLYSTFLSGSIHWLTEFTLKGVAKA